MNLDAISDESLCAPDILHMMILKGGALSEMNRVKRQEGGTLYYGISAMLGDSDKAAV